MKAETRVMIGLGLCAVLVSLWALHSFGFLSVSRPFDSEPLIFSAHTPHALGVEVGFPVHINTETGKQTAGEVVKVSRVSTGIRFELAIGPQYSEGAAGLIVTPPGGNRDPTVELVSNSGGVSERPSLLPVTVVPVEPDGFLEPAPQWIMKRNDPDFKELLSHLSGRRETRSLAEAISKGTPADSLIPEATLALKFYPNVPQLRLAASFLFQRRHNHAQIMDLLEPLLAQDDLPATTRILAEGTFATAAYYLGLYSQSQSHFETALDAAEKSTPSSSKKDDLLLNLALSRKKRGQNIEALDILERNNLEAHDAITLRAGILFRMRRLDEALELLKELSPNSLIASINYGILLREDGQTYRAIENFRWLSQEWPEQPLIHYHLGKSLMIVDEFKEAQDAFLKAAETAVDPSLKEIYLTEAKSAAAYLGDKTGL